ncbi:hypothetical protein RHSIM_Rhsim05G0177900 [Rhododendron simsii]|uniref:Uncharacterized protein n=1 Tax=Rhododendron simsii TaxID=118357 RepID=A0A834LQA9_RHOSS|nr:hypothetical protein RHSIM_Rhsim05G0177900 [Rhododendron simsii]
MHVHMGFHAKAIFVFTVLLLFGCRENLATRPLEGEEWLNDLKTLAIQSLQRGPVTPSGSSPCTYIPGGTRGRCTLAENESNYSGRMGHVAAPAFPGVMVKFATANDSQKQDGSS